MNVIITGGSRGIGRALVEEFLAHGAQVAFCSQNPANVSRAMAEIKSTFPNAKIIAEPVDVTNAQSVQAFISKVMSDFKHIDVLINNAGTYIPGNISEQSFEDLDQQMRTNLYSAFHVTQAVLPAMLDKHSGHIFNMCSIASLKAYPGGGAYSISKHALLGYNDNLRDELKDKGVKVTALVPGAIYTDSWAGSGVPEERIMPVKDIAQTVYQASQLSAQTVLERIVFRPQLGDI